MEKTKKVYDFPFDQVQAQVTQALRKNGNRGTVADVVGLSGLPKHQVETVLPAVVSQCRGHLAVTESGEILYKFPQGVRNAEKSLGKKLLSWTAKFLRGLFKAWILVMLVGYFVLFVAILLVALLVSFALSFMRRDDDSEGAAVGGLVGGLMVSRVLEFFLILWLYSGDPYERQQKKKKPFYKAVFEFVFGVEEKPEIRAKMERKAAISLIRQKKGTVSLEELMALTGKDRAEADAFASRLLLEFEGEPRVTENGTLNFWFPELLKTSSDAKAYTLPDLEPIPFTRNPPKTNKWIIGFNGFNLALSLYFLAYGIGGPAALGTNPDNFSLIYQITLALAAVFGHTNIEAANGGLTLVLGVVPLVYSAFFFGIPAIRRWKEKAKNLRRQADNLRRRVVAAVLARPVGFPVDQLPSDGVSDAQAMVHDLAGSRSVDVVSDQPLVYSIPDLEREQKDLEQVRQETDLSKLALGKVVFDTEDRLE
jgi:hypothetical protein